MAQNRSTGIHAAQAPQPQRTKQSARGRQSARTQPKTQTAKPKSRRQPPSPRRIRIDSPVSLLAAVPVLLGFQPGDNSMVVVGTEWQRARVKLTLRYDLPDPPDARLAADMARHAAGVLAAQRIQRAVAVGYGPAHLVNPIADALREHAPAAGITVTELLRAEHQNFWSYLCAEPTCCSPAGTPFDISAHPVTRAFAGTGTTTVLASRAELAATVAPVDGDLAEAMHHATRKAQENVARLVSRVARSERRASARRLIATVGVRAVAAAIDQYRRGESAGLPAAAWLTVVLRDLRVRDDAWARMEPAYREAHLRMWTDLTRMARPGYVSAAASLLAFVAWQSGNGALANVALDRALEDDPDYSMAQLLRLAIDSGAPPSLARLPMTPEEVAVSYDEQEAGDEGDLL